LLFFPLLGLKNYAYGGENWAEMAYQMGKLAELKVNKI